MATQCHCSALRKRKTMSVPVPVVNARFTNDIDIDERANVDSSPNTACVYGKRN